MTRVLRRTCHVALEGVDGSGKSAALGAIAHALRAHGYTVTEVNYTAPAGITGWVIKRLYQPPAPPNRLVASLRAWRPLQAIIYALNGRVNLSRRDRGAQILLSDRSAMTGYASHLGRVPPWFLAVVEPLRIPDVVIFLDVDLTVAGQRLGRRGALGPEENAASMRDFQRRYDHVIENPPRRLRRTDIRRVDASGAPATVVDAAHSRILDALLTRPAMPDEPRGLK